MNRSPIWNATYRLQLTPEFGFEAAANIVGYLQHLGISHVYLSPIFEARPGSTHGYDQTDPTRIREALGGEQGFDRLVNAAHREGFGLLLDIVPNHMAAHHSNPWWAGLLRHGRGSRFDRYFDVDWDCASGRVVLPVLGAPLAEVLASRELSVDVSDSRGPCVRYFDLLFPLRDDLVVSADVTSSNDLEDLLSRQHFELAFWRDGLARINYRRFFDIADLAGVRIEDEAVFEELHAKVFDLVRRGHIAGVRVDHIDGLLDPLQYLQRLRRGLDEAGSPGHHVPIFIEKILARDESMPDAWPVDGTTGYEFLAVATGLMADGAGVASLRRHAAEVGSSAADFDDLAISCKQEVATSILEPELARVCREAAACLRAAGLTPDPANLRRAMLRLSSCLPVYRTYGDDTGVCDLDIERVRGAARRAADRSHPDPGSRELEQLTDLLTLSGRFEDGRSRAQALRIVKQWQQFTGPLAAKGVEDTALYRDMACPALNDVGSEPVPFDAIAALRGLAEQRQERPLSFNATDTHDAKRSEDARARLAALSHHPGEWMQLLGDATARLSKVVDRRAGPSPTVTTLSLIIHSAFALWPSTGSPDRGVADRLAAYITKAMREAKQSTSWTNPDAGYEDACRSAVEQLLFAEPLADVRARIADLACAIRPFAARLSIGAVVLKCLFPGTPDFYQGTEFRSLYLVDPDNRRPVDFAGRRRVLDQVQAAWNADPGSASAAFLEDPDSDLAKTFVMWRALTVRRQLLSQGKAMALESCTFTSSQWRWVVSVGGRRCLVTASLRSPGASRASPGNSTDPNGVDQLSGRVPGTTSPWLSIVAEGINSLWSSDAATPSRTRDVL